MAKYMPEASNTYKPRPEVWNPEDSTMDDELERLKRRRMLELRRRMMAEHEAEKAKREEPSPADILRSRFTGRAWEVYSAAKAQYPEVMPQVEQALVEGIKSGRIQDRIDGESLFLFLRRLGLNVRLQTSIRYKEHGELKSIGQRLKEK
ncbi:MAG: double-stranded DNA-binding protein [Candidatus Bathyarchaeota archaeon]|nr:MAG: double-stranded DNA-binding protein [Candidatus Bathyarchaeota archaeon]